MFGIVGGAGALVALGTVYMYNDLVKTRLKVDNQWSQIDVQLKMRADLLPNLVETVKGYAAHEKATLDEVISARSRYLTAKTPEDMMNASGELSGVLSKLFALSEAYPDLKANQNFLDLQGRLADIEEKIANYRQFYNDTVMMYNQKIQTVPTNIVAALFSFKESSFWRADEADKALPKVKF